MSYPKSTVSRPCQHCGQHFFPRTDLIIKPRGGIFCSAQCRNLDRIIPFAVKFQRCVGHTTESGCIIWIGSKTEKGYGYIYSEGRNRKRLRAHRVAYEQSVGPIPDDLDVLHRCDNPSCINPDHLFLGTNSDNHRDKIAKGRTAKGEMIGSSRLTVGDVTEIRERYSAGILQRTLADEFGVTRSSISDVVTRRKWKHVK